MDDYLVRLNKTGYHYIDTIDIELSKKTQFFTDQTNKYANLLEKRNNLIDCKFFMEKNKHFIGIKG